MRPVEEILRDLNDFLKFNVMMGRLVIQDDNTWEGFAKGIGKEADEACRPFEDAEGEDFHWGNYVLVKFGTAEDVEKYFDTEAAKA